MVLLEVFWTPSVRETSVRYHEISEAKAMSDVDPTHFTRSFAPHFTAFPPPFGRTRSSGVTGHHGPLRCHPCRTSGPRLTGRRDGWAPCVAGESFAQKEASIWVIRELDVYAYMEKKKDVSQSLAKMVSF